MSAPDVTYSRAGFDDFLQRYESAGLTRERQAELIALALTHDITLDQVVMDAVCRTARFLRRHLLAVVVLLLAAGVVGFVAVAEGRARAGHADYQPWQFELAAVLRRTQITLLGWFNWEVIYDLNCLIVNPYVLWKNAMEDKEVDCEENPQVLSTTTAAEYSGELNEKFALPLLLSESQDTWKLRPQSTITELYQMLELDNNMDYPCHHFPGKVKSSAADPVKELIAGTLVDKQGNPITAIFLEGCSRESNKRLRGLTTRPIFLDPHIEALKAMQAIVTKGIPGQVLFSAQMKPEEMTTFIWIAQVVGNSEIILQDQLCPDAPAKNIIMNPGDTLVLSPDDLARLEVRGPEERIIIYSTFVTEAD